MAGLDAYKYSGKRVLVVGGATGMGAASARLVQELEGEVVVMDVAEVDYDCAQTISIDLRDQSAVDQAIDAIDGNVDAIFACAGVADGTPGLMAINFTSQRYLVERMVAEKKLNAGGSIAFISSTAGLGWRNNIEQVADYLSNESWDDAEAWTAAHPDTDHYGFSKQAINLYVARESYRLLKSGHRINAIMPGPTNTPLAQANADLWLTYAADFRADAGVETLQPEQMASTLVFLCSDAANGINGELTQVDQGHTNAALSDGYDAPLVKMLAGEIEFDLKVLGFE